MKTLPKILALLLLLLSTCSLLLCCGAFFAMSDPNARLLLSVFDNLINQPAPGTPGRPILFTPTPAPLAFAGKGDDVVKFRVHRRGLVEIFAHHSGDSNFVVKLLDSDGNHLKLLVNEIGRYDGRKATNLPAGRYLIEVSASGPWQISIKATQ